MPGRVCYSLSRGHRSCSLATMRLCDGVCSSRQPAGCHVISDVSRWHSQAGVPLVAESGVQERLSGSPNVGSLGGLSGWLISLPTSCGLRTASRGAAGLSGGWWPPGLVADVPRGLL